MPFALASSANSRFHVSNPAGELPHCAASAPVARQASIAIAAHPAAISLPLIKPSVDLDFKLQTVAQYPELMRLHPKAAFPHRCEISDRPPSRSARSLPSDRWWIGRTGAGSPP